MSIDSFFNQVQRSVITYKIQLCAKQNLADRSTHSPRKTVKLDT